MGGWMMDSWMNGVWVDELIIRWVCRHEFTNK